MSDKYVRFQHKIVTALARPVMLIATRLMYGFRHKTRMPSYPCLILCNHVAELDPIFVGLAFKQPIYYVASDHIFRKGLISRLLVWAVAPIPIVKSQMDISTIKTMLRVKKEGGSLCLFPEGNRTFSGVTGSISETIPKLVKTLKMPVHFMRLQGGYMTHPRWSLSHRKGLMYIERGRTLSAQEIDETPADELYKIICAELYVDAYALQEQKGIRYRGKGLAEALETSLFVCPHCHGIGTMKSAGSIFFCTACGLETAIDEAGYLANCDYRTVTEWYEYQRRYMVEAVRDGVFDERDMCDDDQELYLCARGSSSELIMRGGIRMNAHRLLVTDGANSCVYPLAEITKMIVHGRKTLQFNHGGEFYEIKSTAERSALKYMALYYLSSQKNGGNIHGFIGI